MATYIARVRVGSKVEEYNFIAESVDDARRMATQTGRVMSIRRSRSLGNMLARGMNGPERVIFLGRLATMVQSKMGLSDSLKVMRGAFGGTVARVSDELMRRVESGDDFGEAVVRMPKDFPQTTSALIRAGMKGGDIHAALSDAAGFEVEMDRIRRDSSKGVMSAVGSFLLAAAIVISTAFYLGPYVMESDLMRSAGKSVDIGWIFTTADWIAYMMLVVTLLFLGLLFIAFVMKPALPALTDRIILRIPVFRDLVLSQSHYTVFYGLALLIRSGVRIEDALRLSHESAPEGEVAADLMRALEAVKQGKAWPLAMRNLHATDRAALSTSQDREQIATTLNAVAVQYREIYATRVQQVVPVLQMIAALFMSIGGALIFGMVILPMLMMTKEMML